LTKARLGIWTLVTVVVVLATRAIVYALAPQSVLLAALAHNQVGPDVTVPVIIGALGAAAFAAAVLWVAVIAVRERLELEGRRLESTPKLRPRLLAARTICLFLVTSFAFAMLESTIHWREGLGWHGLHCLTGPVHRDAIPVLAALSLVAAAVHGAIEHLLLWARRLFAHLAARSWRLPSAVLSAPSPTPPRASPVVAANGARGPPAQAPSLSVS
jgi:hypothetical protein